MEKRAWKILYLYAFLWAKEELQSKLIMEKYYKSQMYLQQQQQTTDFTPTAR